MACSSRPDLNSDAWSTVQAALQMARTCLAEAGVLEPAVDARHLVAYALGLDRAALLRAPERALSPLDRERLAEALRRRCDREPVSRIMGERDFFGLRMTLGPETLDPRPDTESLVNAVLALASEPSAAPVPPLRILDLGTGTGAIVLALLSALPGSTATATDISAQALAIARQNAERYGLADRVRFLRANWLEQIEDQFDFIVSNPPYIRTSEIAALAPEVARWDPLAALDGGPDGLAAYRTILASVRRVLAPDGWVVFEVGHDQAEQVAALAADQGLQPLPLNTTLLRDLGGHTRCVAATSSRKWENNSWNRGARSLAYGPGKAGGASDPTRF